LSGALPPADFERIIDTQLALLGPPTRRSERGAPSAPVR